MRGCEFSDNWIGLTVDASELAAPLYFLLREWFLSGLAVKVSGDTCQPLLQLKKRKTAHVKTRTPDCSKTTASCHFCCFKIKVKATALRPTYTHTHTSCSLLQCV